MPQIYGIGHVQIAMPMGAEDQARSFYRDLLARLEFFSTGRRHFRFQTQSYE